MSSTPQLPPRSTASALWICATNWLIPGLGFVLAGDKKRGAALFVLITAVSIAGIAMGGYIMVPVWSIRNPDFNPVALLTYLVQAFHGCVWLSLQYLHEASGANPGAFFNLQRLAATYSYSDLGCLHLVVAGGLNYHSTVRLYDILTGSPELSAPDYEAELAAKGDQA